MPQAHNPPLKGVDGLTSGRRADAFANSGRKPPKVPFANCMSKILRFGKKGELMTFVCRKCGEHYGPGVDAVVEDCLNAIIRRSEEAGPSDQAGVLRWALVQLYAEAASGGPDFFARLSNGVSADIDYVARDPARRAVQVGHEGSTGIDDAARCRVEDAIRRAAGKRGVALHWQCMKCQERQPFPSESSSSRPATPVQPPRKITCQRCGHEINGGVTICPHCGRAQWSGIGCISLLCIALVLFGISSTGVWRWLATVAGVLLFVFPIRQTIKSLTWSKRNKAPSGNLPLRYHFNANALTAKLQSRCQRMQPAARRANASNAIRRSMSRLSEPKAASNTTRLIAARFRRHVVQESERVHDQRRTSPHSHSNLYPNVIMAPLAQMDYDRVYAFRETPEKDYGIVPPCSRMRSRLFSATISLSNRGGTSPRCMINLKQSLIGRVVPATQSSSICRQVRASSRLLPLS